MEQKIDINSMIVSSNHQPMLMSVLTGLTQKAFVSCRAVLGDVDITTLDSDTVQIACNAINPDALVKLQVDHQGDKECMYHEIPVELLEAEGLLDQDDIQKAFKNAFTGYDLDFEEMHIQSAEELYKEERKYA